MNMKEYQSITSEIVDLIDKKFNIDRDPQLNFTQLMEEIGELAKVVNSRRLRNKEVDKENLKEEFADVFIQLAKLSDTFGIDLEKAIQDKIKVLKKRHNLE